jgi:hypothetical protein
VRSDTEPYQSGPDRRLARGPQLVGKPGHELQGFCTQSHRHHGAHGRIVAISIAIQRAKSESVMLYTLVIVLLALWLLGLVTSTTMGGLIHILLVIAIVVLLLQVIGGRKIL